MNKKNIYLSLIIILILFLSLIPIIKNSSISQKKIEKKIKSNNELCTNYTNKYDENIANKIEKETKKYLNIPYIFGSKYNNISSTNPYEKYIGIDCSDFVESVLEEVLQKEFETTAADMAYQLRNNCVKLKNIKKGDIIFWNDILNSRVSERFGNIFHVGIYLGNNRIIEATENTKYGIKGVSYSDLYRNRGGNIIMITRPY